MVQFDYVNSSIAKREGLTCWRRYKQIWSAGELSFRSGEYRAGFAGFYVGHKQRVRSISKGIDHQMIAVAEAIHSEIARQSFRRDLRSAHQMKTSFSSGNLGFSFDFVAGESSRHDELNRAQLQPNARTFELDQCQFCFNRWQHLACIFSKAETQKLGPAGRMTVTHPLAGQDICGLLSVANSIGTRQADRDGKRHQQGSLEDYFDHDVIF